MNPISDPNPVFSHDAVKFVYQEPDMRMVNPAMLTIKPFKVKPPEKAKKNNKGENKKKEEGEKENPHHGFFDLF